MDKIIKLKTNEYLPKELPHGGILMNDGEDIDFTNFAVEPEPCPECPECGDSTEYIYMPNTYNPCIYLTEDGKSIEVLDEDLFTNIMKAESFVQVVSIDNGIDYKEIPNNFSITHVADGGCSIDWNIDENDPYLKGSTFIKIPVSRFYVPEGMETEYEALIQHLSTLEDAMDYMESLFQGVWSIFYFRGQPE